MMVDDDSGGFEFWLVYLLLHEDNLDKRDWEGASSLLIKELWESGGH